jgi:hypothetical protein
MNDDIQIVPKIINTNCKDLQSQTINASIFSRQPALTIYYPKNINHHTKCIYIDINDRMVINVVDDILFLGRKKGHLKSIEWLSNDYSFDQSTSILNILLDSQNNKAIMIDVQHPNSVTKFCNRNILSLLYGRQQLIPINIFFNDIKDQQKIMIIMLGNSFVLAIYGFYFTIGKIMENTLLWLTKTGEYSICDMDSIKVFSWLAYELATIGW